MRGLIKKDFKDYNFSMYLIENDKGISSQLNSPNYKSRERAFVSLMHKNIKEGDICCDIGANIGYTAMHMMYSMNKNGKIYAFEPDNRNFQVLQENIKLNNVENMFVLENNGISDRHGNLKFYASDKSNLGSFSKTKHSTNEVDISVESIDNYFNDVEYLPVFYKMDVEGHEVNVLRGMKKTMKRSSSGTKILMEIHPLIYNIQEFSSEILAMSELGFVFKNLISAGEPCPSAFMEKGYEPIEVFNCGKYSRGLYENIPYKDAIELCNYLYYNKKKKRNDKIVRAILLEKE